MAFVVRRVQLPRGRTGPGNITDTACGTPIPGAARSLVPHAARRGRHRTGPKRSSGTLACPPGLRRRRSAGRGRGSRAGAGARGPGPGLAGRGSAGPRPVR